jgi:hypothetical protein
MKVIQMVYGDSWPEIAALMRRAPGVTLRVVLLRLKKKDEEWRKTRYFFYNFFIFFLYLKKGRVAQDAVFRY